MAKRLKVIISFKKEEIELYNFVKRKRNASCYVKDLIEKDISPKSKVNINPNKDNDLGIDF